MTQSMETAERNAKALKGSEAAVNQVSRKRPSAEYSGKCYRCGRGQHDPQDFRFRDSECHYCGRKGHIALACRKKASAGRHGKRSGRDNTRRGVKHIGADDRDDDVSDSEEEFRIAKIHHLGGAKVVQPLRVEVLVNNKPLSMELDTGAAVSIVSKSQLKALHPSLPLQPSKVSPRTYTGERMSVLGEVNVQVQHNQQRTSLPFMVVGEVGPPLLGRNWLCHLH